MSDVFTSTVLPAVHKYANMRFNGDEFQVTQTISLAWYYWTSRKKDFPASVYARLAVRLVRAGRDLPGCAFLKRDAMTSAIRCGGVDGLRDWHPGPERIAMERELYERVIQNASGRDRTVIEMFLDGAKAKDVAKALGISAPRITQIRQEMMDSVE